MNLTLTYNDNLPKLKYKKDSFVNLPNLHNGQRKLLMSEIQFLTDYYEKYDNTKPKYLLYIGAAGGEHINYLNLLFPELHYILYDKRKFQIKLKDNIEIHNKYFDNKEAEKYKNFNIFIICDIRNLDIDITKQNVSESDQIIAEDMAKQKTWCDIIKPKSALLKFRVSYDNLTTKYYDGNLYFQIWSGNSSTELRLVPDFSKKLKSYNNKNIEEILYYYNLITRRQKVKNAKYLCLGEYHENQVEGFIINKYLKKFQVNIDSLDKICELSISITLFLEKFLKNKIDSQFMKYKN